MIKNHYENNRKNHDTFKSKRFESNHNKLFQNKKRRNFDRESNESTQRNHRFKEMKKKHNILRKILKIFHTIKKLFCE